MFGEQIQRELPDTKVVKTLNTVNAFSWSIRSSSTAATTRWWCPATTPARRPRSRILKEWFGWKDVIDLGDITNARGSGMWVALWVRLFGALQTPMFGLKIVR